MRTLDLALIGNGTIGLLVDSAGSVVWGCFPRFDGDATFCALLDDGAPGAERGIWAIELADLARTEQSYGANTAVLTTRLLHSMARDGLRRGIVTLCIGGGQGIALALEML